MGRSSPSVIGHYWCEGIPALPAPNIACLDYSAVKYGRLVAYRWDGETPLNADNFVWVEVIKKSVPKPIYMETIFINLRCLNIQGFTFFL